MLSTRSIALQGFGITTLAVAVQGFTPYTDPLQPLVQQPAGVGSDESRITAARAQFKLERLQDDEILLSLIAEVVTTGALDQWNCEQS